jgi:hypothetical protein
MDSTTLLEKQLEVLTTPAARALFAPDSVESGRFATKVPHALRQRIREHCILHGLAVHEFVTQAIQDGLRPPEDGPTALGDPVRPEAEGALHEPTEGVVMMTVFPQCPKCSTGPLLPLSDYGGDGGTILFKAWACINPACGFSLRVDKGVVSYATVQGVRSK